MTNMAVEHKDIFIDKYIHWLKENISSYQFNNGITEITVPFLNQRNDFMQIYVIDKGNGLYELSDDSATINDLEMYGVTLNTTARIAVFNKIINGYGVQRNENDELVINCSIDSFAQRKNMLIQAMHSVSNMFMLSRKSVRNVFIEDVQQYLDDNEIQYVPDIQIAGKSGLTHKFDFALPSTKSSKERLVSTINSLDMLAAKLHLLSIIEIKAVRKSDFMVIFNDVDNKVSEDAKSSLQSYQTILVPWSQKERYMDSLRGVA